LRRHIELPFELGLAGDRAKDLGFYKFGKLDGLFSWGPLMLEDALVCIVARSVSMNPSPRKDPTLRDIAFAIKFLTMGHPNIPQNVRA
jgi:hypothetical protein